MMSGGAAPSSAPAMIWPQLKTSPLIRVVTMPTGSTSSVVDVVKASGYRDSAHDTVKQKEVAAMREGTATGMKILVSVCIQVAPSISAASSSSLGIDAK